MNLNSRRPRRRRRNPRSVRSLGNKILSVPKSFIQPFLNTSPRKKGYGCRKGRRRRRI